MLRVPASMVLTEIPCASDRSSVKLGEHSESSAGWSVVSSVGKLSAHR